MKKVLIALVAAAVLPSAYAETEKKGYLEFGVGKSSVDVSTQTYSGTALGVTLTNAKANYDYKDPTTYGFEVGVANFLGTPLRVGFGVTILDLEFEKASGSGTITTAAGTVTLSGSATAADFRGIGLSFDNDVKVYLVNAYYDIKTEGAIKPYVGFGLGLTDIENAKDKETTLAVHAGLNYELQNNMYVGGKFSHYRISGATDTLGVQYDDTTVNYVGVTLGVRF
jgi:opacity protein-like surface antigen